MPCPVEPHPRQSFLVGRQKDLSKRCLVFGRVSHNSHMSAQAVGGAVGHNPISILIPCHRGGGAGGRLTGYAGVWDFLRQGLPRVLRQVFSNRSQTPERLPALFQRDTSFPTMGETAVSISARIMWVLGALAFSFTP